MERTPIILILALNQMYIYLVIKYWLQQELLLKFRLILCVAPIWNPGATDLIKYKCICNWFSGLKVSCSLFVLEEKKTWVVSFL